MINSPGQTVHKMSPIKESTSPVPAKATCPPTLPPVRNTSDTAQESHPIPGYPEILAQSAQWAARRLIDHHQTFDTECPTSGRQPMGAAKSTVSPRSPAIDWSTCIRTLSPNYYNEQLRHGQTAAVIQWLSHDQPLDHQLRAATGAIEHDISQLRDPREILTRRRQFMAFLIIVVQHIQKIGHPHSVFPPAANIPLFDLIDRQISIGNLKTETKPAGKFRFKYGEHPAMGRIYFENRESGITYRSRRERDILVPGYEPQLITKYRIRSINDLINTFTRLDFAINMVPDRLKQSNPTVSLSQPFMYTGSHHHRKIPKVAVISPKLQKLAADQFPPHQQAQFYQKIVQMLAQFHADGLIHNNINPGIFLLDRDKIKISNFNFVMVPDEHKFEIRGHTTRWFGGTFPPPENLWPDTDKKRIPPLNLTKIDMWGIGASLLCDQLSYYCGNRNIGTVNYQDYTPSILDPVEQLSTILSANGFKIHSIEFIEAFIKKTIHLIFFQSAQRRMHRLGHLISGCLKTTLDSRLSATDFLAHPYFTHKLIDTEPDVI